MPTKADITGPPGLPNPPRSGSPGRKVGPPEPPKSHPTPLPPERLALQPPPDPVDGVHPGRLRPPRLLTNLWSQAFWAGAGFLPAFRRLGAAVGSRSPGARTDGVGQLGCAARAKRAALDGRPAPAALQGSLELIEGHFQPALLNPPADPGDARPRGGAHLRNPGPGVLPQVRAHRLEGVQLSLLTGRADGFGSRHQPAASQAVPQGHGGSPPPLRASLTAFGRPAAGAQGSRSRSVRPTAATRPTTFRTPARSRLRAASSRVAPVV